MDDEEKDEFHESLSAALGSTVRGIAKCLSEQKGHHKMAKFMSRILVKLFRMYHPGTCKWFNHTAHPLPFPRYRPSSVTSQSASVFAQSMQSTCRQCQPYRVFLVMRQFCLGVVELILGRVLVLSPSGGRNGGIGLRGGCLRGRGGSIGGRGRFSRGLDGRRTCVNESIHFDVKEFRSIFLFILLLLTLELIVKLLFFINILS